MGEAPQPTPLPPGMTEAFYTLSAYVFGSKAVSVTKELISGRRSKNGQENLSSGS
jgi:hypothetical protein